MTTVNKAKFKINASLANDRGFDATSAQVLTIELEDATDVTSVTFDLYDPDEENSPLASLDAPDLTFAGSVHSITPALPSNSVTITMVTNTTETHTWMLRATAYVGSVVYVYERIIALKNALPRKTLPSESTQYGERGWSDAWSELIDFVVANMGGGGGVQLGQVTGITWSDVDPQSYVDFNLGTLTPAAAPSTPAVAQFTSSQGGPMVIVSANINSSAELEISVTYALPETEGPAQSPTGDVNVLYTPA